MVIEVLYPKLCNLYGDRGNVIYLQQCLPDAEFIETGINDKPYFADHKVDLIYLGPASESAQITFVDRLMPYKDRLNQLIEENVVFLLTGNAMEVFGTEVKDKDGSGFKGLGLINLSATRDMLGRKNCLYYGSFNEIMIVGFQTQFTIAESNEQSLFKNEFGMGLHPGSTTEGVRKNNLLGTYLIGPLLVLNPHFTKYLLNLLGIENPKIALEEQVNEAYQLRVEDFIRAQKINHLK